MKFNGSYWRIVSALEVWLLARGRGVIRRRDREEEFIASFEFIGVGLWIVIESGGEKYNPVKSIALDSGIRRLN